MILVSFQGKSFNITVIQVYAPATKIKEAEFECFCEDLQHILELTPKRSQKIPGVTASLALGYKMKQVKG